MASDDPDADLALELLRELAVQEESREDRGVSRARQSFTLAAGFFAVVQTVSFSSFSQRLIVGSERRELLYLSAAAGLLLTVCGVLLLVTDRAFRSYTLSTDKIVDVVNESRAAGTSARDLFIGLYAQLVDELRMTNSKRYSAVFFTQLFALLSLLAVLIELVYSLHTRLGR